MATAGLRLSAIAAAVRLPSASLRRHVSTQSLRFHVNSPSLRLLSSSTSFRRRQRNGGATMMDTAASSYANAIADVAKSNNTLEATLADMEKLDRAFSDSSIQSYFANPTVSIEKKQELISEISKSSELQPHVTNFLNILVEMGRIDIIKEIIKNFEAAYNGITGTEVAVVTSVVKLEQQHLAQIAATVQKLTKAKNVRIKTAIDPSLVAGFTVRYGSSGSKLIDMSVRKQLDEIAAQLDFANIMLVS